MRRQIIARGAWIGVLTALIVASGGLAQPMVDPDLQGRLLRRSDGTLYVYKDGVRYPVVPADLADAQIDAIPAAGLLVVRVNDLFGLAGSGDSAPAATSPAPSPPSAAIIDSGPLGPALAGLTGQTVRVCDLLRNPLNAQVERAERIAGTDGRPHLLLVVSVTNLGTRTATGYPPVQLRDERGRAFDLTATGLGTDLTTIARQYGVQRAGQQELPPGIPDRQVWTFQVPEDVQSLSVAQNPLTSCAGVTS